jgi:hypothetical protein
MTTMRMQVEGVFLCSAFCSLTLLLEFERRKKSLSIEVLYKSQSSWNAEL